MIHRRVGADIVVVADDSGSMNEVASGMTTRWEELQTTLQALAEMLLVIDHSDGFNVQFLNDPTWHRVTAPDQVRSLFQSRGAPRGRTPLMTRLKPLLDGSFHPKGQNAETDVLLLIMTDGVPRQCLSGHRRSSRCLASYVGPRSLRS